MRIHPSRSAVAATTATSARVSPASALLAQHAKELLRKQAQNIEKPSSTFTASLDSPSVGKLAPPVQDPLLSYTSRLIMKHGKLLTAQGHITTMLNHLRLLTNDDPLKLFRNAVAKAAPSLKIVSQKLTGTKRVDLPLPLTEKQRVRRGIMAIAQASDKRIRSETKFGRRLAMEVLSVLDGNSEVLNKKQQIHKAAVLARSNIGGKQRPNI